MPQPVTLETATFEEVWWDSKGNVKPNTPTGNPPKKFPVQFNPASMKLNYTNQKSGGDQPQGSSTQFVGKAVTKLTLELWFDIALAQAQGRVDPGTDVTQLTQEIAYFLAPQKVPGSGKTNTVPPPGLRIQWGSFSFEGTMDSMDETLEFFSADGLPLRANVSISVSKQEISYDANTAATLQDPQSAGVQPYTPMTASKPFQQAAAEAGNSDWQSAALANGIENPRMLSAGALVNFNAGASISASAQLGVTAQTSGSLSASVSFGAQAGVSAGVSGGVSASVSGGFSAGVSGGANAGVSAGARSGISLGFVGSGQVGAGASFGFTS